LLHFAACIGDPEIINILAKSKRMKLAKLDGDTGVNAFWFAAFYGRGEACAILAELGIDILVQHKETRSNALHVAIMRKHYKLAIMLIQSKFPLNEVKKGGITALHLACLDHDAIGVANYLVKKGADI
jgi:ankyrin repeat protein